ncbi:MULTISPECIES: molybdopterin converting factor subunit 1 [unclassified Agarivorans]|uniref:molybdopterin converting factor subunit 1 n=1 Tax=unclassified Agarivorans TaxID=2636026 RepID=UPI0026E306A7|nr:MULTISPECIES: molybdopterin converting factor subunit 1 [unclassified Agarivorans]MDO6686026.1 molybdopterin converting factor subunit 1 [Agarivorans sp. 3_MG-2023]MDO6713836.1 molybdopterin converting factor subunit 1 [Agarivorans sp. 2_MG-2023]
MQVKVLFFARLKEQLGYSNLSLELAEGSNTTQLKAELVSKGEQWTILGDSSVLMAVNQQHISDVKSLANGDEVAFFPPVTGG